MLSFTKRLLIASLFVWPPIVLLLVASKVFG